MNPKILPLPEHYSPSSVSEVWRVPYQERAKEAEKWAKKFNITPSSQDKFKIYLLLIDVQNTFCIPGFELYVGGASGQSAIDDNRRLCEFIYHNLKLITEISLTMDTHQAVQIFHSIFFINDKGEHPEPHTTISSDDIESGIWKFNDVNASSLQITASHGQELIQYYTSKLKDGGKYDLTVWPYHGIVTGIGHAIVSAVEEAVFFQSIARYSQLDIQMKGSNPFTENYSALSPEVLLKANENKISENNSKLIERLNNSDAVIIAGQAKSHCVASTIDDLFHDSHLAKKDFMNKMYFLEDCSSAVVIPGVIDYTKTTNKIFKKFIDAGMHMVKSTTPINKWPGICI